MAALGAGIQVSKGIANTDSTIGVVIVANGLVAGADVNLLNVNYNFNNGSVPLPIEVGGGFSIEGFLGFGGRISAKYVLPSTIQIEIDGGVGIGTGFSFYEVNAVIKEGQ